MKKECNCEQALRYLTALEYIEQVCMRSKPEAVVRNRIYTITLMALGRHDEDEEPAVLSLVKEEE